MNVPQTLADLRHHQAICRELLALSERECRALAENQPEVLTEASRRRRELVPALSESLEKVKSHRASWQLLTATERQSQPEVGYLIRQTQDLIMRVILLDRENEQGLLRRGLIPPREIPAANAQRPHHVINLYRRNPGR